MASAHQSPWELTRRIRIESQTVSSDSNSRIIGPRVKLDNNTLRNQLGAILAEETEAAHQLLVVLRREREALTLRALDEIRAMAERKQSCIERLEDLASRQNSLFRRIGIDPGDAELPVSLRNMGLQSVADQWNAVRQLLKDCQKENQVNGGIIEMSRRFAQQVLNTLKGATSEGRLYGPTGDAKSESSKKGPIATA